MEIRIITDSGSDISQEKAGKWGIRVLPMTVRFDDTEYRDGIDLMPADFYRMLENSRELPKTSQVTPYAFETAFREEAAKGVDVLCITVSSGLSGTYGSARLAASVVQEDYPDWTVYVIDSLNACSSEYIMVLQAVRLRDQGMSIKDIAHTMHDLRKRVRILALVDTLDYVQKGGRISAAAAAIGGLLSIKPVISLKDGKVIIVGKARGSANGNNLLVRTIKNSGGIDFDYPICISYGGHSDDQLQKYLEDSRELYEGQTDNIPVEMVGPTIGTYSGPGVIVCAYYGKE